ncbi:MAG: PAS domain-containing protein [Betaproteobacteria bacterium]
MSQSPAPQIPEIRFETVFEQAPFSMQLLAADGRTLRVNKAWESLWSPQGAGLKEWVLREYNVLDDPQLEKQGVTRELRRAFAGESVQLPAIRYDPAQLGKAGEARWVRAYAHPIKDADGRVREVMLIHEDVSDRVAADEALRESEKRLKQLANTIPQLAWMANANGYIHWYNDRWYQYTGTTPEQMEGWGWQQVHHPKELPWVLDLWKRSLDTGAPFEMTFPLRGKDGAFRPFLTRVEPLRDEDGRIVQWFGTNTDVSELEQAQRNLRAAEERLRIAVLAGNIGIWDWDLQSDVVSWSEEVYRLHGLQPETHGRPAAAFTALVHPDDRPDLERRLATAISRAEGFSSEYRAVLPNGETRWLSTWASITLGDDGRPLRMIGAVISIDPYKKAEAALRESDQRKDEFLAMLAHELRNPLAPITTAAEIIRLAGAEPARTQAAAEVIARQVRHITKLMDDLLDVSRVTRGLVNIERRPVDLASVVHTAIEQVSPLLQEKAHSLTTNLKSTHPCVLGDRARLIQIVANLLNNAARYTSNGGHIEIALEADSDEATLRVSDNGQGIERDLIPRLFELFTQGKRSPDRSQGGLGIGLALVKRLVELHGGQIRAESAGPGQGSTITVTLPCAHAAEGDAARASGPAAKRGHVPLRIMVVDDNRDAADSLAELLTAMGHEVRTRYDAMDVLAAAESERMDAFVIDIGLPGMDGRSLARSLRSRGIDATLVALTGYGQPADHELSYESGFDHHLVKPAEWPALAEVLGDRRRNRNVP